MKPFNVLLKKNFKQKLLSKTFIITTALYLVAVLAFAFWSDIKGIFSGGDDAVQEVIVFNETEAAMDSYFVDSDTQTFEFTDNREAVTAFVEDDAEHIGLVLKEKDGQLATELVSQEPLPLTEQESFNGLINLLSNRRN